MASSATPTPWYCPPPFSDYIRWWDDFFLKLPRPPTPDKLDINPNHLVPLKSHCPEYSTLVPFSKIFFVCAHVLGVFPASSNKTLKLSPFLHPHTPQISTISTLRMKTLINKTIIAAMEAFCKSLCLKIIGNNHTLSWGKKRTLLGIAEGWIIFVNRGDYNIYVYSLARRWYKKTLAGYLVDKSHLFGGPISWLDYNPKLNSTNEYNHAMHVMSTNKEARQRWLMSSKFWSCYNKTQGEPDKTNTI